MSSFLIIAALAVADSLPDPLRDLANSADAFADAIDALDRETQAVVADAALVHNVSSNATAREAVVKYFGEKLTAGMPSARSCDKAEEAAMAAATAFKKADLQCKQARLEFLHKKAWVGASPTAAEQAELGELRKASAAEDAKCTAAKADVERKVHAAETADEELVAATRAYARRFEAHVAELMRAARSREETAKKDMNKAISEGQRATQEEMKKRKVDEQTGEETSLKAELWAEGHEKVIEHASDNAHDDLERIYEPVLRLARKSVEAAERAAKDRRARLHRAVRSGERVSELLQLQEEKEGADDGSKALPPDAPAWLPWAAGLVVLLSTAALKHCCCCKHRAVAKHSAAAGSALFAAIAGREGLAMQQPLLAEERI